MAKKKKPRRANGEGTFKTRKDGRVEYRVVVGTAIDGSYIRKSFYGDTETECREKHRKYLRDNPIPLDKVKTVEEYAKNWLPIYKKGKVTNGTYYEYELIVNNIVIPGIGKIKFPELRRSHIEKLMRSVTHYSISRQRKVCFLVKAIIESAVDDRFCRENVAAKIEAPKKIEKEIDIFSADEINKLLNFEHHFAPAIKLLFYTGMRRGELIALTWNNVDFKNNVIHVTRALSDGVIKEQTKGKRDRLVPMTDECKVFLKSLPRNSLTVISKPDGSPITKDYYNYWYKRFVQLAGVEYKSGHKCRHCYITYSLKSGAKTINVQNAAGHADLKQTEHYAKVIQKDFIKDGRKLKYK